jgi:23S rRNA pseudouridine955/2504/2580 synthase
MSSPKILCIDASQADQRLDRFLRQTFLHLTQGVIEKSLRKRDLKINDKPSTSSYRIQEGDIVTMSPFLASIIDIKPEPPKPKPITPEEKAWIRERILFEDEHMLIFNKPSGIPSQGGSKIKESLDSLFQRAFPSIHLVHRLDRHTSGVMVFAKSRKMATYLCEQFKNRTAEKIYETILKGYIFPGDGFINAPLIKKRIGGSEKVFVDFDEGAEAKTSYRQLGKSRRSELSYIEASPKTGRNHQLRAHFAYAGCPILGDDKYGEPPFNETDTLCLHAKSLTIRDLDGTRYTFHAPLPNHMEDVLKRFFH